MISAKETIDEGLKTFDVFERKYPQDKRIPEIILLDASTKQNIGRFDDAIRDYERLIERFPHTLEAYKGKFLLGYLYYDNLKDTEKATRVFGEFIKMYPDSELTVSARVLLENIDLPVEEWSTVKSIEKNVQDSAMSR